MRTRKIGILVFLLLTSVFILPTVKQQPTAEKSTLMVPMCDGVKLATDIYLPTGEGS